MRITLLFLVLSTSFLVRAEDGYRLWLRYDLIEDASLRNRYAQGAAFVHGEEVSAVAKTATRELLKGLGGLLGIKINDGPKEEGDKGIYLGIRGKSTRIDAFLNSNNLPELGSEGYHLARDKGDLLIIADGEKGLLYGAFHLLRLMRMGESLVSLSRTERPAYEHRILNHWDNLDRTVERGYAGFSIWNWHQLPDFIDQRYVDYARANASVGINGTVVTNVNANSLVFRGDYLDKAAALADVFRPYGIKLYLTARFSSPMELGGLETADPLDPSVVAWWKEKVGEVYARIPDFGGFLVKANSEGQPGPREYGRSHAEGANMLADALKPHGGIVMWRAFVYTDKEGGDRFREAYDEFRPLDGKFRKNVMLQIKNGPIDFQPREPVSPLFAAMPRTPLLLEFQITKEYLGQGTHTVGLASMYEEILNTNMHPDEEGGSVHELVSGIAGVSNIGTARNWTGNLFGQADWFAFGRLSWSPKASARDIFRDWATLTFGRNPTVVEKVTQMLTISYPACVNYMTPLGLHHIMATGHHYGPGPWVNDLGRDDWNPYYYHRATKDSVGFDRTSTGSDALSQYPPSFAEQYQDPETCPPEFLLWFHRVPWSMSLPNGNDLWREVGLRYQRGVEQVNEMGEIWNSMKSEIDPERFRYVSQHLNIQRKEAAWWRDACLTYFRSINGRQLPAEVPAPSRSLKSYVDEFHPYSPGIRPQW